MGTEWFWSQQAPLHMQLISHMVFGNLFKLSGPRRPRLHNVDARGNYTLWGAVLRVSM